MKNISEEEIKSAVENIWLKKTENEQLIKNCIEFTVRHWERAEINLYL